MIGKREKELNRKRKKRIRGEKGAGLALLHYEEGKNDSGKLPLSGKGNAGKIINQCNLDYLNSGLLKERERRIVHRELCGYAKKRGRKRVKRNEQ